MRTASGALTLAACVLVGWHGWHFRCEVHPRLRAFGSPLVGHGVTVGESAGPVVFRFGFRSMEARALVGGREQVDSATYTARQSGAIRVLFWAGWCYVLMLGCAGMLMAFRRFRFAPLAPLAGVVAMGLAVSWALHAHLRPFLGEDAPLAVVYDVAPTWSSYAAGLAWIAALFLAWLAPRPRPRSSGGGTPTDAFD